MTLSLELSAIVGPLLSTIGLPVLLVAFYLEGMVIGKVVRPGAIFVLYLLILRPPIPKLVVVAGLCATATTVGQWTMYRGFNDDRPDLVGLRRRVSVLDRVLRAARSTVERRQLAIVDRLFGRFGGVAICISNLVPGVRCLMSIPAGVNRYPVERFVAYALAGNVLYIGVLVVITRGLLGVAGYLPWP